jgi:hypothetical protein
MRVSGEQFAKHHSKELRRLLRKWRQLAAHRIWDDDLKDCSWWYGERGSVSQLAGAAWALGGWAIQDYAWERQRPKRYAQIDLCVENRPLKFIAEAKQIWPCLTKPHSLRRRVEETFETLKKELDCVDSQGWPRWMFVFVSPWTRKAQGVSGAMLNEFLAALSKPRGAVVWTFPPWARNRNVVYSQRPTFYPGVALLARKL